MLIAYIYTIGTAHAAIARDNCTSEINSICNGNSTAHATATLTECSNTHNMASAVTYAVVTAHTTVATAYATATPTKCCSICREHLHARW